MTSPITLLQHFRPAVSFIDSLIQWISQHKRMQTKHCLHNMIIFCKEWCSLLTTVWEDWIYWKKNILLMCAFWTKVWGAHIILGDLLFSEGQCKIQYSNAILRCSGDGVDSRRRTVHGWSLPIWRLGAGHLWQHSGGDYPVPPRVSRILQVPWRCSMP